MSEEQKDGAALLCADPSAAVTTEALPNGGINWKRIGCWFRFGHRLPLILEHHAITCGRCGYSWTE